MITWGEIRYIFRTLLRWWWVFLLAIPLAGVSAYYITMNETKYYRTRATLRIGKAFESSAPNPNEISVGTALARYYGELAGRERILKPVQEKLQLSFPWQLISDKMLLTDIKPSGNLLEIYIEDTNPERAQQIAAAIAAQLIAESPTSPEKIATEQAAINQQLEETDRKIKDLDAKIESVQAQQREATSASDLAELNQTYEQLTEALQKEQANYNSLLALKNNSSVNTISLFEPATTPFLLPSKRKIIIGTAGLAGLALSLVAIFILEHLDGRWRNRRDLKDRFQMDNLGDLPSGPPLMVAIEPYAGARLKAMREIQTNILLTSTDHDIRTLMIASPSKSEPRTVFSIDLADLFARSGHKVLLVDADFCHASLTRLLAPMEITQSWATMLNNEHSDIWAHLCSTPLSNVALLPGGGNAHGSPALIPSLRWREIVNELLQAVDIIIFDGPGVLDGPDAALLAPFVDGTVLVLDPRTDDREAVDKSKTRLTHRKGARLIGAITLTPSGEPSRFELFWQQLRNRRRLELPVASSVETITNYRQAIDPPTPVTPAPTRSPIITPVDDIQGQSSSSEYRDIQKQPTAPLPDQTLATRRPRKASRSSHRRPIRPADASVEHAQKKQP